MCMEKRNTLEIEEWHNMVLLQTRVTGCYHTVISVKRRMGKSGWGDSQFEMLILFRWKNCVHIMYKYSELFYSDKQTTAGTY